MTTTNLTPNTLTVKPICVIWEVGAGKKAARVEVTPNGAASCACDNWILFGECAHVEAVQQERARRGLKAH